MRRAMLVVVIWTAANVAAVALAWGGVQVVASQVTERRVGPMSRRDVVEALRAGSPMPPPTSVGSIADEPPVPPPGAPPASPTSVIPPRAESQPTPRGPAPSPSPRAAATQRPAPVHPAGAASNSPTTTAAPTPTSPPTTAAPPTTAPSTGATATTKTIDSIGGQVAVRYESGRVELMWARPKPGFEVEVADDGPEEVEVRFESRDHESRITAFWKGATPSHEVREGD